MAGLSQDFNEQNGNAPQNAVISSVQMDFSPETANEKVEFTQYAVEEADLTHVNVNVVDMLVGNSGNEGIINSIEEQSSVSGDELGDSHSLELDVDEDSYLAGMNSRTKLLSDVSQEVYEHEKLSHINSDHSGLVGVAGVEHFDLNAPEIHEENDLELAIQRTIEILAEAGVPESELNKAMAAGGIDNNFETLESLADVADQYKIPEAQGYLNLVQADMSQMGIGGKMAVFASAPAANDEHYDLVDPQQKLNTGTQPSMLRFG